MKIVLQRVSYGSVSVDQKLVGEINKGLVPVSYTHLDVYKRQY